MTTLMRTKIVTSGYIGGPGVNVLHLSAGTSGTWTQENLDGAFEELNSVYDSLKNMYPTEVDILPDAEIQEIDEVTGNIVNVWTQTGWADVVGGTSGSTAISRGACLVAAFATDIWHEGKRLRGRSFLGPITTNALTGTGQTDASWVELVEDSYVALTSGVGPRLAVYHRPASGASSGGYYGDVVEVRCGLHPSNLRSRVT